MEYQVLERGKCHQRSTQNKDLFDYVRVKIVYETRFVVMFYKRQLVYKTDEFNNEFVITEQKKFKQALKTKKQKELLEEQAEEQAKRVTQVSLLED